MSILRHDEVACGARLTGIKPCERRVQTTDNDPTTEDDRTIENERALETVRHLRAKLDDYRRGLPRSAKFVSTGITSLDALLPHNGLPCGSTVEILAGTKSTGAMALAMRVAAQGRSYDDFSGGGRSIVVIDTAGDFYPPAASQHGVEIDRLVVLRVRNFKDAFWAADQSLRCPAVAVVIASLDRLDAKESRRLQLAARSSGAVGLLLRSPRHDGKSFAALRLLLESAPLANTPTKNKTPPPTASCRITLLTVREGIAGQSIEVDLHHETNHGPLHTALADRPLTRTGS